MTQALIVYLAIGAMVALILAVGGAKAEVRIDILGRDISPLWVAGALLVLAFTVWPLVIWLMIAAVRSEAAKAREVAAVAERTAADAAEQGLVYDPKLGRYVNQPPKPSRLFAKAPPDGD